MNKDTTQRIDTRELPDDEAAEIIAAAAVDRAKSAEYRNPYPAMTAQARVYFDAWTLADISHELGGDTT